MSGAQALRGAILGAGLVIATQAAAQDYLPPGAEVVPRGQVEAFFAAGGVLCTAPVSGLGGDCGDVTYVDRFDGDRFEIINVYSDGPGILGVYVIQSQWQGDRFCDVGAAPVIYFGRARAADNVHRYDLRDFVKDTAQIDMANALIGTDEPSCYEFYRDADAPEVWQEVGFIGGDYARNSVAYTLLPRRPLDTGTWLSTF